MNDVAGIALIIVGVPLIVYAELKSETNVVRAVLENRGVETTQKITRANLNADSLYRQSNLCFVLFVLVFAASLWIFKSFSGWATTVATLAIIGSAGLAFTMRAIALIRVINRLQAQSTEPR